MIEISPGRIIYGRSIQRAIYKTYNFYQKSIKVLITATEYYSLIRGYLGVEIVTSG